MSHGIAGFEAYAGRCDGCRQLVTVAEYEAFAHPCKLAGISYNLRSFINPDNTPGLPGWAFKVEQDSVNVSRTWRMKPRVYRVIFQLDREGVLQHTGGPKPTSAAAKKRKKKAKAAQS
jgi:hypothetical protein